MKARRLLEGGCTGYLASEVDIHVEQSLKPKYVLVVRYVLEVFLDDLQRLPPNR